MSSNENERKLRIVIAIAFGILTSISVIVALCSNGDHFLTATLCAVITISALVE